MVHLLAGFPDNVVAVAASGYITSVDYDGVLVPAIDGAFRRHRKIRFYCELDPTVVDVRAAWDDFKLGVEHLMPWERIAAVTDASWVQSGANIFRPFIPGKMRVFGAGQADEARRWIVEEA